MRAEDVEPVLDRRALLQIGEVAHRVGLSLRTVRYYEEVGLFTPSARSPGGFRLYSAADVERLAILKGMKPVPTCSRASSASGSAAAACSRAARGWARARRRPGRPMARA